MCVLCLQNVCVAMLVGMHEWRVCVCVCVICVFVCGDAWLGQPRGSALVRFMPRCSTAAC